MSFKKYLDKIQEPSVIFTFGRNNPIHKEHEMLFKDLYDYSKKHKYKDAIVYTSWSHNHKKNPLSPKDKIYFIRKIVPKGVRVSDDTSLINPYQILEDLIKNKKYKRIGFMVGEDQYNAFQALKKYAKQWGDEIGEEIDFKVLKRKGKRTKGISGTDMRNYTKNNDFESFKKYAPSKLTNEEIKDLFEKTKNGLEN